MCMELSEKSHTDCKGKGKLMEINEMVSHIMTKITSTDELNHLKKRSRTVRYA